MNSELFADRLKMAMGEESNSGFAKKCGLSESAIRNYLKGQTTPDLDTLGKIAEVSGYSLAWLASGEGEKRRAVTITKATPEGFGNAKELTFKIYPADFRTRLQKEMGGLDDRKPAWLSKESGLHIDKIIEFLTGEAIPTVDELIALASALGVSEAWLAEGNAKRNNRESGLVEADNGTISKYIINESGLDTDLLKYILAAVELVTDDIGRDSDVFSVSDRIMIVIRLYNTHIKQEMRPLVNLDRMIEQAYYSYFLRAPIDELEKLRTKATNEKKQSLLDMVNTYLELRYDAVNIEEELKKRQVTSKD